MKVNNSLTKYYLVTLFCASLFLSCKDDGCVTCEKKLTNSTVTQELCNDGPDVSVKITLIGIVSDSTVSNSTIEAYQAKLVSDGYSCK